MRQVNQQDIRILNVQQHPQLAEYELGAVTLHATLHARERAAERGIQLPTLLDICAGSIVEVEVSGRTLTKLVVRKKSRTKADHEDVFVIRPETAKMWNVISCYMNHVEDVHKTLNLRRLEMIRPEEF